MAGLVINDSRLICQIVTGSSGTFHSEHASAYGTKLVGAALPGNGRAGHLGLAAFYNIGAQKIVKAVRG